MRSDGSEVLYGEDWDARKKQLWERCGGRCEYTQWDTGEPATDFKNIAFQERCRKECQIPAHVEPRYPRRDDRMSNLKGYCIEHDRLMEKQSWRKIRSDRREHAAKNGI